MVGDKFNQSINSAALIYFISTVPPEEKNNESKSPATGLLGFLFYFLHRLWHVT